MTKNKWEWLDQPLTWRKWLKFEAVCCAISTVIGIAYAIYTWWSTRELFTPVKSAPTEDFNFETEE